MVEWKVYCWHRRQKIDGRNDSFGDEIFPHWALVVEGIDITNPHCIKMLVGNPIKTMGNKSSLKKSSI